MYKIDIEEVKNEAKLMDKVKSELLELKHIADFVENMPRIAITAFQGVGRLFVECTEHKYNLALLNEIQNIVHKYYTISEQNINSNALCTTIYFLYDCSDDGVEPVFEE